MVKYMLHPNELFGMMITMSKHTLPNFVDHNNGQVEIQPVQKKIHFFNFNKIA